MWHFHNVDSGVPKKGVVRGTFGLRNSEMVPLTVFLYISKMYHFPKTIWNLNGNFSNYLMFQPPAAVESPCEYDSTHRPVGEHADPDSHWTET